MLGNTPFNIKGKIVKLSVSGAAKPPISSKWAFPQYNEFPSEFSLGILAVKWWLFLEIL